MKIQLILLVALSFIFFNSCRENTIEDILESIESAEDNSLIENEFTAVFEFANSEGTENEDFYGAKIKDTKNDIIAGLTPDCVDISIDTSNRIITIDFGDENCLCNDGRYRRGKINAQFDGKWKDVGSSITATLEDYYLNDIHFTGTKIIERLADNKWEITVTNASAETQDGTVYWECVRTTERTEGNDTPLWVWDDEYKYEGSASGVNRKGINFTVIIEEPLIKVINPGCFKNFTEGIWTVTNEDGASMSLDYYPIDGNCDKVADIIINGKSRRITLR